MCINEHKDNSKEILAHGIHLTNADNDLDVTTTKKENSAPCTHLDPGEDKNTLKAIGSVIEYCLIHNPPIMQCKRLSQQLSRGWPAEPQ